MDKKILREWISLDYTSDVIKESREKNGGRLMLTGIIQKADILNQNKRVYPMGVLQREIENYSKAVREDRAVGELDHPTEATVSLQNVSHIVREMWWDGNNVMGRIEVLGTPKGKILETLLESGVRIGISSRGVGSTERANEGHDIVQSDFVLSAFDIVAEPSTIGAYLYTEAKAVAPRLSRADRVFRALNDILTTER